MSLTASSVKELFLSSKFIFNNLLFNATKYSKSYVKISGKNKIVIENDYVEGDNKSFTNGLQIVESFAKNSNLKITHKHSGGIYKVVISIK